MSAFWIERGARGVRLLETGWPAALVRSACAGIAVSTWVRPPPAVDAGVGTLAVAGALVSRDLRRLALTAAALALLGLWWGTLRNDALERSVLAERLGRTAPARVVVTGPVSRTAFAVRTPAEAVRFGATSIRERVLLELPPERAPPQGAVLELRARPVTAAWARDRLRRARLARASRRARGVARRRRLAHRRPAGRDRWRRRPAARARGGDARPGNHGGAPPPAHGHRPRRGLGHRQGAAGRLPGERPPAPA